MFQPFIPKEGQGDAFQFDKTPTYLFRLYTTGSSAGSTSTNHVASPAHLKKRNDDGCRVDLLQLPPEVVVKRLTDHISWKGEHTSGCNLMSWSSSLLCLLQYGLYCHKNDPKTPPLSNIHLIMIDTREFPKRTFLRDLDAIRHYYRSDSDMAEMKDLKMLKEWREQDYYMGEYLTQGLLNIEDKCCQVSMQQLINTGLFYLCPPLKSSEWNDWARWGKTVFRIRTSFYEPRPLEETQVEKAVSIAQHCKRETFIFPFAVMLLALQNRDAGDELLYREFRRKFTGKVVYHIWLMPR
jgi:hypothetical protein